jgi:TPR repeat protein
VLSVILLALISASPAPSQGPALEPACAAGNVSACVQASARLLKAGRAADSAASLAHSLKACELGDGGACNSYGYALVTGEGIPANPPAAAPYYLRGCELGSAPACRNYGFNLLKGLYGMAKDEAKGAGYLARSCSADNQNACVELALAERAGLPGHSAKDALARLIWACDKLNARGCVQAGYSLRDSLGVPADLPASVSFFKRACDQPGVAETDPYNAGEGCASLAWAYQSGVGVARNLGRAASLYRRGCDLGSAYSCTGLGLAILDGTAGARDTSAAAALFAKACGLRQPAGCGNQGRLLTFGWRGAPPDSVRGRRLLQESCDQDFIVGCRWLAEAARNGVGGPRDSAAALTWYEKACDRRDGPACVELGLAYTNGAGRPRDDRKAIAIYEVACAVGNSFGCNNLGVALRTGPQDLQDVARANRLFDQECRRDNPRSCANLGFSYEYGRGVALDEGRAIQLYKQACVKADAYGCAQLKRIAPDSLAILGPSIRADSSRRVGASSGIQSAIQGEGVPDASRGLWALVVGLSRYASPEIRPLTYARKDAESFARFLMSPQGGGFPADHVNLLVDEKATADALRRGLHTFLRRANQGDLVVIYFAGHGRQPGNQAGIPYFLTYDTDPREMGATAVPMDELRRAVQQSITARYIVAFVDACHSGGVTLATRGSSDNDLINRYLQELSRSKETVVTLSASQENQESLEGPEYGGGHGAFTWHLLQGLGGDADRVSEGGDESGTVTLSELAYYVTRKVKAATRNLQEPSLTYLKWDPSLVLSVIRPR